MWEDVLTWEAEYGRQWDGLVVAANDIGSHWPRTLHHWVTLHPLKLARWLAARAQQRLVPDDHYETWSQVPTFTDGGDDPHRVVMHRLEPWVGATSGMFAAQVALHLGCTHVILCGIPVTPTAHFAESRERFAPEWQQAHLHINAWKRLKPQLELRVRSMSGRTQELLGAPSRKWLHGGDR